MDNVYNLAQKRHDKKHTVSDWGKQFRQTTTILILICLSAVNAYSWLMTSNGLFLSEFIPPNNALLSAETMTYSVCFILQLVIMGFYLVMPRTFHSWFALPILLFGLICIAASIWLSLVSISDQAIGDQLLTNRATDIAQLNHHLTAVDKHISASYQSKIRALDTLVQRAIDGKDYSGIAKCGRNCKRLSKQADSLRSHYSILAKNTLPETANIITWQQIQNNYARLVPKLDLFKQFSAETRLKTPEILQQLHYSMDRIKASFDKNGENSFHLTIEWLNPAHADFSDMRLYLAIFLAVLPDILSLMLTCFISFIERFDLQHAVIMREIKRNKLLDKSHKYNKNTREEMNRSKIEDEHHQHLWSMFSQKIK